MREKLVKSVLFSLEWRLYAFVITALFLWATTDELVFAAMSAFGLQIVLFIGHTTWYYFRQEGAYGFTLDALATRLARSIIRTFSRHNPE
ncbi:MAG: hypothetical protein AAB573_02900 [Patescibacteria group bacterium]